MSGKPGNGGTGWAKAEGGKWVKTNQSPDAIAKAEELLDAVRRKRSERVDGIAANLPPDATLFTRAKAILVDLAENAGDDKDRISAAKALVEATRPLPQQVIRMEQQGDLGQLSPEQLKKELEEAQALLAHDETAKVRLA